MRLSAEPQVSVPAELVIRVVGNDLCLAWADDRNLHHRVHSDIASNDNFTTLVGSTPDTTLIIVNGALVARQFYRVVGSTTP